MDILLKEIQLVVAPTEMAQHGTVALAVVSEKVMINIVHKRGEA